MSTRVAEDQCNQLPLDTMHKIRIDWYLTSHKSLTVYTKAETKNVLGCQGSWTNWLLLGLCICCRDLIDSCMNYLFVQFSLFTQSLLVQLVTCSLWCASPCSKEPFDYCMVWTCFFLWFSSNASQYFLFLWKVLCLVTNGVKRLTTNHQQHQILRISPI